MAVPDPPRQRPSPQRRPPEGGAGAGGAGPLVVGRAGPGPPGGRGRPGRGRAAAGVIPGCAPPPPSATHALSERLALYPSPCRNRRNSVKGILLFFGMGHFLQLLANSVAELRKSAHGRCIQEILDRHPHRNSLACCEQVKALALAEVAL